jgi:hypothetical protein
MARIIAHTHACVASRATALRLPHDDLLRSAIVSGCALALILARTSLPF